MATLEGPMFEYEDPGRFTAAVLTVLTHALLAVLLFVGVRWQNRPPDAVFAELWTETALPAPAPEAQQKIETPPEPAKAEPKAAPKPEKPDIAVERERQRKLKEQKALEEKAAKEKAAKEKAAQEQAEAKYRKELADQERKRMFDQAARETSESAATPSAPNVGAPSLVGDPKARAEYADRIKAKIRPNIVVPPGMDADREAIFDVEQFPTGEVRTVKLRKSSGVRAYDEAVERAIRKASPLPRPDHPELFARELELRFRPYD